MYTNMYLQNPEQWKQNLKKLLNSMYVRYSQVPSYSVDHKVDSNNTSQHAHFHHKTTEMAKTMTSHFQRWGNYRLEKPNLRSVNKLSDVEIPPLRNEVLHLQHSFNRISTHPFNCWWWNNYLCIKYLREKRKIRTSLSINWRPRISWRSFCLLCNR